MKSWAAIAVVALLSWLGAACSSSTDACGGCDDGVSCTVDTCDEASTTCLNSPNDSLCSSGQRCDPQQGCVTAPVCEVNADCNDLVYCNGDEVCQGGACQSPGRDCSDGVDCTRDSCDETMNQCLHLPDDTLCAAEEECDVEQGCELLQPCINAFECDDDDPCSEDTCEAQRCRHAPLSGPACDDDLFCTDNDTCAAGVCSGTPRVCPPADYPCDENVCDEASGQCQTRQRAEGAACDDGNYCTVGEACHANECDGGQPRDCSEDLGPCQAGVCDVNEQACVGEPANDSEPCDDLDPCTTDDICYYGECVGELNECEDGNTCTRDACDPVTGECVWTPDPSCKPTGEPCQINNECVGGICLVDEDGFPGGVCTQYCGAGMRPCVGEADCLEMPAGEVCLARCPLSGGDTCPRVGYMCVTSGHGDTGVCAPGEDLCQDGQDNDGDQQADCDDYDCGVAPNCLQTCTPLAAITCGQTLQGTLSGSSSYLYYGACSSHAYGGPDAVYGFTAPEDGFLTLTLDGNGIYSALMVLEGECHPQLTCVDHDEQFGLDDEVVRIPVVSGTTYYAVVEGYGVDDQGPFSLTAACGQPELCADSLDNDLDGLADCADPDCARDPACQGHEFNCADDLDNDDDGDIDCVDLDCEPTPVCQPETACTDLEDNDLDGLTDCEDYDCYPVAYCQAETECQDGRDNDADGLTDCHDDDCDAVYECQVELNCHDEIDNDADGREDCEDADCESTPVCLPESACGDTVDNDLDGLTDCGDPDCSADLLCAERCSANGSLQGCWAQVNGTTTGLTNHFSEYGCTDYYQLTGPEIVYAYTPSTSGTVLFTLAPQFDAVLFVFQGECAPASVDACLGYVEVLQGSQDYVELEVVAGQTYYVIIDSENAAQQGNFVFRADCYGTEVCNDGADNDLDGRTDCADIDWEDCYYAPNCTPTCTASEELDCGAWLLADSTSSSSNINDYGGMCPHEDYPGGEKVYHYRASTPTTVDVQLEASLFTDIALIVTSNTCTPARSAEVCEDDYTGWDPIPPREHVYWDAEPGVDYYILVDSFQSGRKYFLLSVTCTATK